MMTLCRINRWSFVFAAVLGVSLAVSGCCRGSHGKSDAASLSVDEPRSEEVVVRKEIKSCLSENLRRMAVEDPSLGIGAPEAERLVREIMSKLGSDKQPIVISCSFIEKAEAVYLDQDIPIDEYGSILAGEYIIYNQTWFSEVSGEDRGQAIALFGHEAGHLINGDFIAPRRSKPVLELERDADKRLGCALARMGIEFDGAEDLLSRLRGDEPNGRYPSRAESLQAAKDGFVGCGGNPVKACRLPENGVESWGFSQDVDQESGWRGGGGSPDRYCNELIGALRERLPRASSFEVLHKGEKQETTCAPFNCPQYKYRCIVRATGEPLYAEARSTNCP